MGNSIDAPLKIPEDETLPIGIPPGLAPMIEDINWSKNRAFQFEIYNPQDADTGLSVRIDDRENYHGYTD